MNEGDSKTLRINTADVLYIAIGEDESTIWTASADGRVHSAPPMNIKTERVPFLFFQAIHRGMTISPRKIMQRDGVVIFGDAYLEFAKKQMETGGMGTIP